MPRAAQNVGPLSRNHLIIRRCAMRARWVAAMTLGLGLLVTGAARADDVSEARAVVDKAIKAMGKDVAEKGAKYKAVIMKIKGTVHIMSAALPYNGEFAVQLPEQSRLTIEGEAMGQTFKLILVVNGDKGWIKLMDKTVDLDKEKLAQEKAANYVRWVTLLTPLQDKAFSLSPLGEVKVGKAEAVGVKVSHKKHQDVNLFFDKKTGLLVKSESRVKDDSGKEVTEEILYSDFKEVEGIKRPTKIAIKRDGNEFLDGETTDYKLVEKLDDSEFAKP
jgi:outer membrane lipoprotein-sorting protein